MKSLLFLWLSLLITYSASAATFNTGDIIFRQEETLLSKIFSTIENSPYAHAGIIWKNKGKIYIVHLEIADGQNGLRVQTWNEFLKHAARWKVVRHTTLPDQSRFEPVIRKYIRLKPTFNAYFTKGTEKNMYCTEFVQVVYKEALGINIAPTRSMYKGKVFIATKDIYSSPLLFEIASHSQQKGKH